MEVVVEVVEVAAGVEAEVGAQTGMQAEVDPQTTCTLEEGKANAKKNVYLVS